MLRVLRSTSTAGRRLPSTVLTRRCEITAFRRHGEVLQQHRAHFQREEADHAVHGLVGVVRVQRGEAEVAGQRVGERHAHRLQVADLADQDAVGSLAHGVAQRVVEAARVVAHLALVEERFLGREHVLDRVLDGEDVPGGDRIAVVEHRGERRRLARAGGAHHEDQAALLHHERGEHGRQAQVDDLRDVGGDEADHRGAPRPSARTCSRGSCRGRPWASRSSARDRARTSRSGAA